MRKQFFLCMFAITSLFADDPLVQTIDEDKGEEIALPWLTGPLLASASATIPKGHLNLEPYLYAVANTASYNHHWKSREIKTVWNTYSQTLIQFGITTWMDFQTSPTIYYNFTDGAASWAFGDLPIQVGFQLYQNQGKATDWITSLKLNVREVIPSGKYRNLSPSKKTTDAGGGGSWQTVFNLVWGNLFYLGGVHFLSTRLSLSYTLPAPVYVKNLNIYGGGRGTKGTVYPSQNFQFDLAGEFTLTKNWALALDVVGSWSGKTRFKGTTTIKNTEPSSTQFSLAPAIEYNWSEQLGIILGPWFTIAGRNAAKFSSAVFALNYYY